MRGACGCAVATREGAELAICATELQSAAGRVCSEEQKWRLSANWLSLGPRFSKSAVVRSKTKDAAFSSVISSIRSWFQSY